MFYWRIWTDAAGESHLEQVDVALRPIEGYAAGVPPVDVSKAFPAGEAHFSLLPAGWFGDWHPAPSRQFVVLLSGALHVTTSDGASMTGKSGCVWLIEDTTGRGHQTRVVGNADALRISITLPS